MRYSKVIKFLVILTYIIITFCEVTFGKVLEDESSHNAETNAYCFRFTWLGPKFNGDNENELRKLTCADVTDGAKGIPCRKPLVVTNNSAIPDTNLLWDTYKNKPKEFGCRLTAGEVCAKISYRYGGAIQNITYTCTKVTIDKVGKAPLGCYKNTKNSKEIEVCTCESKPNETPCNNSDILLTNFKLIFNLFSVYFVSSIFSLNNF